MLQMCFVPAEWELLVAYFEVVEKLPKFLGTCPCILLQYAKLASARK